MIENRRRRLLNSGGLEKTINPNRKIFEARKRETAALGAGEKLVLGHPLAATIGDSARCMQNLEKVLFTGPKTSDTVSLFAIRVNDDDGGLNVGLSVQSAT